MALFKRKRQGFSEAILQALCWKAFQIKDLDELTHFMESVIVVALSKCIGSGPNDEVLPSVHRMRYLNNRIKGVELKNDNDDEDDIEATSKEADDKGDGASEFDIQQDTVESEKGNRG